jgi:Concanavalin A-like lectin/glucanases superfamily/Protein of unknown function (DUF2793)
VTTPILGLPELSGNTNEKTLVNLVNRYQEALSFPVPTGQVNVSTVPTAPTDGSVYLINGTPTGVWSGKEGTAGIYTGSGWFFALKHPGYTYAAGTWTANGGTVGGSGSGLPNFLILPYQSTDPSPVPTSLVLFARPDGNLYTVNPNGTITQVGSGGGGGSPSTLFTAFWKADESSGNLVDSVGGLILTPFNSPTYSPTGGLVNGCVNFSGDGTANSGQSAFVSGGSFPALEGGTNVPIFATCAIKLNSTSGAQFFYGKYDVDLPGTNAEWLFDYAGGNFDFAIYDSTTNAVVSVSVPTTVVSTNWYILMAWFDPIADTLSLSVNNGTPVTVSVPSGFSVRNTGALLRLGAAYTSLQYGLDGSLDCVGFSNSGIPTSTQRTIIYNGGLGYQP